MDYAPPGSIKNCPEEDAGPSELCTKHREEVPRETTYREILGMW
ncbi:hypothetical protein [Vulcanisaeta sp. JCM 16159]